MPAPEVGPTCCESVPTPTANRERAVSSKADRQQAGDISENHLRSPVRSSRSSNTKVPRRLRRLRATFCFCAGEIFATLGPCRFRLSAFHKCAIGNAPPGPPARPRRKSSAASAKKVAARAHELTRPGDTILILAGKGHNGDDARAAQRISARTQRRIAERGRSAGGARKTRSTQDASPALCVDGLFGIGLNRALDDGWRHFITMRQ